MKQFFYILKYFGIAAGSITTLFFVFTFFDGIRDDIGGIKIDVEMISVEQVWIAEGIASIRDTLEEFEKEHKIQGQHIESISWGLKNHENFTPEQFEDVMEELLKKNIGPIVLKTDNPRLYLYR